MFGRTQGAIRVKATRLGIRVPAVREWAVNTREPSAQVAWLTEFARVDDDGCLIWAGAVAGRPPAPVVEWGGRRYRARRLLASLLGLLNDESMVVYSSCGKRMCMKREHLRVGPRSEAIQVAIARGRWCTGVRRAAITAAKRAKRAKLPITEHETVRAMRAAGMTTEKIAEHYGVTRGRVTRAIQSWGRITGRPL